MSYVHGQAVTTVGPGGGTTDAPTTSPPLGTTAAPTTTPMAPTTTPMVTTTPPMVTTTPPMVTTTPPTTPGVITTPPPPYPYLTNSPPCKGTCTCTWSGSDWNCDANCGDCLCLPPTTVDVTQDAGANDQIPGGTSIEPFVGTFVGQKMPGMCVPKAGGLKTQAGLSSSQIANGRGYEGMPMGLDTSLDQNGNSIQLTSYVSYVNGQKQIKVAKFSKDNLFMDLNIDGLESTKGVIKTGP
jgi:hypothetical protein